MKDRQEFLEKLAGLLALAKENGEHITIQEVEDYFGKENLTKEQMELVFDYLLAQKVVVKGYVKINEEVSEEKEQIVYSEEEQNYLKDYFQELEMIEDIKENEKERLFGQVIKGDEAAKQRLIEVYLRKVVEIAQEMYHPGVFLGDMVQEGNIGLILAVEILSNVGSGQDIENIIVAEIRQSIRTLIKEQTDLKDRDQKMVEKVNELDEAITALTEELGRKVTLEELAVYTGMTEEEVNNLLKLAGEDTDKQMQEEEA